MLSQAITKKNHGLSSKVSYASKIIDLVIDGFSTDNESSQLHICDHSIVIFGI